MDGAQRTTYVDEPRVHADDAGIMGLLKQLRDETTTLLRQEVALAKTEMSEKASRSIRQGAYLAVGGAVLYAGVLALVGALAIAVAWLFAQADISAWAASFWGFLLTGLIVAAVGYGLVQKAISTLKEETLVPEKSVETMKENKQWLQNKTV